MERAELKYRKLKIGKVPYFMGLTMKANGVILRKVLRLRENGSNSNNQYLTRIVKIVEYHGNFTKGYLSLETIDNVIIKSESESEYMALRKTGAGI